MINCHNIVFKSHLVGAIKWIQNARCKYLRHYHLTAASRGTGLNVVWILNLKPSTKCQNSIHLIMCKITYITKYAHPWELCTCYWGSSADYHRNNGTSIQYHKWHITKKEDAIWTIMYIKYNCNESTSDDLMLSYLFKNEWSLRYVSCFLNINFRKRWAWYTSKYGITKIYIRNAE
jgi:hypothetical protein